MAGFRKPAPPAREGLAGKIVGALALGFTLLPLAALVVEWTQGGGAGSHSTDIAGLWELFTSPGTLRTIGFSLSQALASTLLALAVGLPGAYFVANYQFPGRRFFLGLSAIPFCLPHVLVVLAFTLYYGQQGWFFSGLRFLGIHVSSSSGFLYSFWGLVFIHAFYNFPIVIQNVGSVWERLPKSREEAARTLGSGKFKAFRMGSLPYLLPSILQSASLIFLFCFFSFTIVLVFGSLEGSTLEVDIYRALRFTGDSSKALVLALVQMIIALVAVWFFSRFDRKTSALMKDFGRVSQRKHLHRPSAIILAIYAALILLFFIGPLASLLVEAFSVRDSPGGAVHFGFGNFTRLLQGTGQTGGPLVRSILNSLMISGSSAIMAIMLGLTVAGSAHSGTNEQGRSSKLAGLVISLPLAVSPALTAFGWGTLSGSMTIIAIIAGQSTIAWPFVARSVGTALGSLDPGKHEAARTLGASPAHATLSVDFGEIMPSIASAAAFAFSMTIGDVTIPLVLGGGMHETLPLLIYRLISSYRFSEACAAGIILALFTGIAFFFKEKSDETS
ncbi:MAG: iron ABC transporter permease [Spirochaetaceae bacterium]|nr:iron ABC transporter permease [Spirochaetaceae bacterium]